MVLLRGMLLAPLVGALTGLLFASPWVVLGLPSEPRVAATFAGFAIWIGAWAGACVGIPTAILLTLISPRLRSTDAAALASCAVTGLVGFTAVLVVGAGVGVGLVLGGGCAIIGAMVGRWVVLGPRKKA